MASLGHSVFKRAIISKTEDNCPYPVALEYT